MPVKATFVANIQLKAMEILKKSQDGIKTLLMQRPVYGKIRVLIKKFKILMFYMRAIDGDDRKLAKCQCRLVSVSSRRCVSSVAMWPRRPEPVTAVLQHPAIQALPWCDSCSASMQNRNVQGTV